MTLAWLEGDLTSVALCWRLDRRDGIAIGFTSHDRDLTIDGLVYRAAPGMTPSAVSVSDGLDVDTLDIAGALTSMRSPPRIWRRGAGMARGRGCSRSIGPARVAARCR